MEIGRLPGWPADQQWLESVGELADAVAELDPPCGLFLPHAGVVFSLLDALAERAIRVPQDVAIIVIDKDVQRTAELAAVPLTAVIPDYWQQGYVAADLVHRIIRGERVEDAVLRVPPVGLERRDSTGEETTRDPVVAKALHEIRSRSLRSLSVGHLVDCSGVGRRTLEQRFRLATGRTLHAAIMDRQIEEAKRLLRTGGRTVAEVAEACGFSSVHYFTTAFKREVGETPGSYARTSV